MLNQHPRALARDVMAANIPPPKVADFDELVDEILAKKGPAEYKDGLSEENWEEVKSPSLSSLLPLSPLCPLLHRRWRRFLCS